MKLRFFDFEVFPNWWCCVFGDMPDNELTENVKSDFVVVRSDVGDARGQLLTLLKQPGYCNIGYNIKSYDLIIANAIYQGFTPQQVKIINDCIIRPDLKWSTKEHIRLQPFAEKRLRGIVYEDLFDDSVGSLKEKECSLGLDIQESTVPFTKENLTENDIQEVISYCRHDVYAAMVFYNKIVEPYADVKNSIGERFGISEEICRKSTNATIVSKVLEAVPSTFADESKQEIAINKKIVGYCKENLPPQIYNHIVSCPDALTVKLFDNIVSFGDGGLHSTLQDNLYVEEDDEWVLRNVDAESYYPSEMVRFGLLSRACRKPDRFETILNERLQLKEKTELTEWDQKVEKGDKLVLNTTYGASGNKYIPLYDPYMRTSVCRTGQMFLAAFANKLYHSIPGLKVIQTNTDGILIYFRKAFIDDVHKLMKEWTEISGIKMDEDIVYKIWQKNVNNYLMVQNKKGKVKTKIKGGWLKDNPFNPGTVKLSPLNGFVAVKAAKEFLLNGTDIVNTIFNTKDIYDFAITCTKGPTFRGVVQRMADGTETELFKCNRVIATTNTNYGMIYKYKYYKGELRYYQMPSIPTNCKLVNKDLTKYDFNELRKEIDYMYYINEAADLLDIEWYQLKGNNISRTNQFDYN